MVALAAATAVVDALTSAVTPTTTPANPTAAQQSSWDKSLATAQLGTSATSTGGAKGTTMAEVMHQAMFSMLQNSVMNSMAEIERNRQEANRDED